MKNNRFIDKLFNLYQRAADYLCDSANDSELGIVSSGADIFVEHEDFLEAYPEAAHVLGKCLAYVNHDSEAGEEPILGCELVEEISGTLGEIFE